MMQSIDDHTSRAGVGGAEDRLRVGLLCCCLRSNGSVYLRRWPDALGSTSCPLTGLNRSTGPSPVKWGTCPSRCLCPETIECGEGTRWSLNATSNHEMSFGPARICPGFFFFTKTQCCTSVFLFSTLSFLPHTFTTCRAHNDPVFTGKARVILPIICMRSLR